MDPLSIIIQGGANFLRKVNDSAEGNAPQPALIVKILNFCMEL